MSKALTRDWFNRVWNANNEQAIAELMCENCAVDGLESPELKRTGFINTFRTFTSVLESIHIDPFEMVEENGKVMGHARLKAIHKATRKEIDIIFSFSAEWRDGKIRSARNVVDFATMLSQVGALDKSVMAKAFQPH